ncbi:MAG: pyridoxal phosphate-dependent aminotransferase family protein [Prosthecobacter sp.]|nr:pyridoxal phosphate-dependent aminotransferase family protein [Prosthecobacter sp.]
MQSPPGAHVTIDGRRYLYFGGTSYFGLHGHPEVIEAGVQALRQYGVHSGTTRAGFGTIAPVLEVEQRAAKLFGTETAFYFSSGYASNHVLIQTLAAQITTVLVEATAHFSVIEAAKSAGLPCHTFDSRDPADLQAQIRRHLPPSGVPLVMADAVAPPTGTLAPVMDYLDALAPFAPAVLMLDDAHGFGVLGVAGRGLFDHHGLWPEVNTGTARADGITLTVGGTLAKALGGFGGIIPGSQAFIHEIRAKSHYFEGASAPAAAVAGSTAKALELVARDPSWRLRVRANATHLRTGLRALGLEVPDTPAAQTGVVIGDAANMKRLHQELRQRGILVPHLAAYSGLGPEGVMRFAVFSTHTPEMIDELLTTLKPLL